jgi:hypothetical protein
MVIIPDLCDVLLREFSGPNAKAMATDIWATDHTLSYHNWRRTARYCADRMREFGLTGVRIHPFPADGKTIIGDRRMPRAWDCEGAELRLLRGDGTSEMLCSYADQPLSLAQYCPATRKSGIEGELVAVEQGDKPADYRGLNVRGKFVLGGANATALAKAAAKRGAAAVLSDWMPTFPPARPDAFDNADAHLWTRTESDGCVAFCLTPRQGRRLRDMVRRADRKQPVRMNAVVRSKSYAGEIWAITGVLAGASNREVAIIPHLFEPGANDNASGCGLALELARCLPHLIRMKRLPPLRRSVRFLFVMEFVTTSAFYIAQPATARRTIAAIVPDMVGNDQARCRSTMIYQTTPDAAPSFINHVILDAFDALQDRVLRPNASGRDAAFKHVAAGYWGNDCFVSDPNIGIPAVGMVEWPDLFYHTSADTPDKVDPETVRRNGALVGAMAVFAAAAGPAEAVALAPRMALRASSDLNRAAREVLAAARVGTSADQRRKAQEAPDQLSRQARHISLREREALGSLEMLADRGRDREAIREVLAPCSAHIDDSARQLVEWVARMVPRPASADAPRPSPSRAEHRARTAVPRRVLPGPILHERLDAAGKKRLGRIHKVGLPRNVAFWIDGRRSVSEIAERSAAETGGADVANLLRYFDLLHDYGYLEWTDRA